MLFVPFKRQGKYNPSLARFCILLALLVLSCTMSHLQMLVSDEGWKVAPVGGAAMSRAFGAESYPCYLIQVVYPYLKYAVRFGIPYFLKKFFETSEYITKIFKWLYEKIGDLPGPLQQSIRRELEMPVRGFAQKSGNCFHYETVLKTRCKPDGTPLKYDFNENWCRENKKKVDENCAYTVKQTLQKTMDILQSEDNTEDSTSLSLAIFAVLGILYSYYCINSGPTPAPTPAAPTPAAPAPAPAPTPAPAPAFPALANIDRGGGIQGGGNISDQEKQNVTSNKRFPKQSLRDIAKRNPPIPGPISTWNKEKLRLAIRKWYNF